MHKIAVVTQSCASGSAAERSLAKFEDPRITADGSKRASVSFKDPTTLWFNTGTLCNIECQNCYINSSPKNDALVYLTADEVSDYLNQLTDRNWPVQEIAFTGGEPFVNPQIIEMLKRSLEAGYEVLVLSNAMRPMMRPGVQAGLLEIEQNWPGKLTIRISLDHHNDRLHDIERGKGSFAVSIKGMDWLHYNGIRMFVAARSIWSESEEEARVGFAQLFRTRNYEIDAFDPIQLVLFPEISPEVEVPEITTDCWSILNKRPEDIMCASSRMVVKRKGARHPTVVACTLMPYDSEFDFGPSLKDAEATVFLNHPSCAQFCVLGGASCSRK